MSGLSVPELPEGCDPLKAALEYASAGWYVGPVKRGTKHPGSVLGNGWQHQTSRDPETIVSWFAGTDHGVFLHAGRSEAVGFDLDHPENMPAVLAEALETCRPPFQTTREVDPFADEEGYGRRGHALFAFPAGRQFGNGTGGLGKGWGEVRGLNGVIIVAPSEHPEPGGEYAWQVTGPVPVLPATVAALLPDGQAGADVAPAARVAELRAKHVGSTRPELLKGPLSRWEAAMGAGASRHESAVDAACQIAREAMAGMYPLAASMDELRALFVEAMGLNVGSGRRVSPVVAGAEFTGIEAWAISQAQAQPGKLAPLAAQAASAPETPAPATEPGGDDEAAPEDLGTGRDGLQRITVANPDVTARQLLGLLGTGGLAGVFLRGSVPFVHTPRIGEAGYIEPSDKRQHLGPAQVRPLTEAQFRGLVEARYSIGNLRTKTTKNAEGEVTSTKQEWEPKLLPRDIARSVLSRAEMDEHAAPNLRTLVGVTHTPTLRGDGSVLDQPGYDDATGMLYLPEPGLAAPPVPERPTAEQVRAAVELILRPVAEFPFITEHDRANWVGLAMTPALRPLLPPPYPLGVFTAPTRGSGKSYLAGMIRALHGGVIKGPFPNDKDEFRKAVTATLETTTAPVVAFDNVRGVIHNADLEMLLTSDRWSARLLGMTKDLDLPNDRLWLVTGNNVTIGGDLGRRCLFVRIDPGRANPHERTGFALNPKTWIPAHRGAYLSAQLTVARAWVLAGHPGEGQARGDDYGVWLASMRAMLDWAGVPGEFGHQDEADRVTSGEDQEWETFMAHLFEAFDGQSFTTAELVERLKRHGVLHTPGSGAPAGVDPEALPGSLAHDWVTAQARMTPNYTGFSRSLGVWLANRRDTWTGEYVMRQEPRLTRSKKEATRWRVEATAVAGTEARNV